MNFIMLLFFFNETEMTEMLIILDVVGRVLDILILVTV